MPQLDNAKLAVDNIAKAFTTANGNIVELRKIVSRTQDPHTREDNTIDPATWKRARSVLEAIEKLNERLEQWADHVG